MIRTIKSYVNRNPLSQTEILCDSLHIRRARGVERMKFDYGRKLR